MSDWTYTTPIKGLFSTNTSSTPFPLAGVGKTAAYRTVPHDVRSDFADNVRDGLEIELERFKTSCTRSRFVQSQIWRPVV